MFLPLDDWQFHAVTLAAGLGLWALLRPFLARRPRRPGCGGCGPPRRRPRATSLTVEGRTAGGSRRS